MGAQDPAATAPVLASNAASEAGEDARTAATSFEGALQSAPADSGPSLVEAPLLHFMRDHVATAMRQGDATALAAAFDQIAAFAPKGPPPEYANWASIAKDGAAAARAASVDGARGACRGCHSQYRNAYKADMRARPLS
jgi:hypothetical protein